MSIEFNSWEIHFSVIPQINFKTKCKFWNTEKIIEIL